MDETRFVLAWDHDEKKFTKIVTDILKYGWQLHGAVFIGPKGYTQAFVKGKEIVSSVETEKPKEK